MAAFVLALVCATHSSAAFAQKAEYDRIIDEAVTEFQAGHWREARALFVQAHAIEPNARTLRGRGMAEFELRHYTKAARSLSAALRDTRRALTPGLREKTQALLQRTRGFVGRYAITLRPQTAVLAVDGQAPQLESNGTLLLDAGEHTLSASAPGHEPIERKLDVRGGEDEAIVLELEAVASTDVAAPTDAPVSEMEPEYDEGGSILSEWWFWTAVVAVAAGTTVAVIVLTGGDDSKPDDTGISTQALVRF